jgi:hypothetical protein
MPRYGRGLIPSPKAAHQIDDEAYQEQQANRAAADGRSAEIKTAAAEKEKQHKEYE